MPVHAVTSAASRPRRTASTGTSAIRNSPLVASDHGLGTRPDTTIRTPVASRAVATSTKSIAVMGGGKVADHRVHRADCELEQLDSACTITPRTAPYLCVLAPPRATGIAHFTGVHDCHDISM